MTLNTLRYRLIEWLKNQYINTSYAQCGEDIIIDFLFRSNNRVVNNYLDLGANHPIIKNNTYLFYCKGARGVNVEPNKVLSNASTDMRPHDTNLNVAISDENHILRYYYFNPGTLNTTNELIAEDYKKQGYRLKDVIEVQSIDIKSLIEEHFGDEPIDVLSLDIEGDELKILQRLEFEKHTIRVICVETVIFSADRTGAKKNDVVEFILSQGYTLYADTNVNSIFVHSSLTQKNHQ